MVQLVLVYQMASIFLTLQQASSQYAHLLVPQLHTVLCQMNCHCGWLKAKKITGIRFYFINSILHTYNCAQGLDSTNSILHIYIYNCAQGLDSIDSILHIYITVHM